MPDMAPSLRVSTVTPGRAVTLLVLGQPVEAHEGEPVAVALWAAGYRTLRHSPERQRARGLFCAGGFCQDCLLVIDGQPNVRACLMPVREGMRVTVPESPSADQGR